MDNLAWSIVSVGIPVLIVLISAYAIWKRVKDKKSGFPLNDERTQKVDGKAAYYAMFMSQYFIIAYLLLNVAGRELFGMPEVESGYPMVATVLVSSVSFLVLRWHLGRKGEL